MTYQPKPLMPVLQWGTRLTRNLIAAFACQSQGSNLVDIASRRDASPVNSPTRSNSPLGRSVAFDGNNQRFDSSDSGFAITGDYLTVGAWISSGTQTKTKPTICAYRGGDGATNPGWLLGFNTTGGNLLFGVSDGTNNSNLQASAPGSGWHHVVGVKTPEGLYLYVDGVLVTSQASTVSIGSVSTTFRIGARSDANTATFWNGSLADLRIWNRSISGNEVGQLYRDPWAMYRPRPLLLRHVGTVHSASGNAQGDATATSVGKVTHSATANAQGQGSVSGEGTVIHADAGSAQGQGTAGASGQVTHGASGAADGQGAVAAASQVTHSAIGSAAGGGTASAIGKVTHDGHGAVEGSASAQASGSVIHSDAGTATGQGDVTGSSNVLHGASGAAVGQGDATGGGAVVHSAAGTAQGDATATGAGSVGRPIYRRPLTSSGQGLPRLYFEELNNFASKASIMSLEGFHFASKHYWGVQPSQWESSEAAWDSGDPLYLPPNSTPARDSGRGFGRWIGPGSVHVRPGNLWLENLDENPIVAARVGHDDIARVGMGALTKATWSWLDVGVGVALNGQVHLVLQNADTGAIIEEQTLGYHVKQAILPALDAHAVLWARMEGVQRSWSLPPDYLPVRGFSVVPDRFKFVENNVAYVWDYEADVGRRPTDLSHPFYALEHQAFLEGRLVHRGEWTQYISDGGSYGAPWSALRIAVGDDDFSVGATYLPYPGPVLYEIEDDSDIETRTALCVDPLALSLSASNVLEWGDNAGECRVGGTIAGRSGPLTAYWHFHPDAPLDNLSATLLGVSERTTVMVCEASLYPKVSDLLEIRPTLPETRSTEFVLTHAFLHQYEPEASDVRERLPGLPRATLGHPGGRCLRLDNGKIRHFTEGFGAVGAKFASDKFAQFYNIAREVDLHQQVRTGSGTEFHGDNCAETCWNSFYGWAQDKPFGHADALQSLAILKSGVWDDSGLAPFPASTYLWQRLRSLGTSEGTRLLASGKAAVNERPLWGISDGQQFREAWLPFRPRRLTPVRDEEGQEWIYAVGRFVAEAEDGLYDVADNWSLIRISGAYVKVCAFWDASYGDAGAFTFDRVEAAEFGLDASKMPPFLCWVVDATQPAGGYWTRRDAAPTDNRYFLTVSYDTETVACTPPEGQGLPYSPAVWDHFCFVVHDDGGIGTGPWPPLPHCTNAECVLPPPTEPPTDPPDDPPTDEICFSWNNNLRRFLVARSEALAAGVNLETFPPFLDWIAAADLEAYPIGGSWQRAEAAPLDETPYLVFVEDVGNNLLAYDVPEGVTLPYEPLLWDRFCFEFGPDGDIPDSPDSPVPHPPQPSAIFYLVEVRQIDGEPWTMIQVSDTSLVDGHHRLRQLRMIAQFIPNLWLRIDSDAPPNDLTTYTIRVPWNEPFSLPQEAHEKIEVVGLYVQSIGATPTFETLRVN